MYNESYEEYIRSILGYPNYGNSRFENNYQYMPTNFTSSEQDRKLETCYPEIYKIVYPMIKKACASNSKSVTPDLVDELTNEIYASIETDNQINLTINLTNEVSSTGNRNTSSSVKSESVKENRGEDRQFRNRSLQDLIRILLIRELLGRPGGFPGNCPPFQPNIPPMRPPFPERPGGRPPIMPRSNYYDNIYE